MATCGSWKRLRRMLSLMSLWRSALSRVRFYECGFREKTAAFPEFEVQLLDGIADEIGVRRKLGGIVVQRPVMRLGQLPERLRVAGFEPLPEPDIELSGVRNVFVLIQIFNVTAMLY